MVDKTTIEQLFAEASDHVARIPESPAARELRTRLDQARRVLDAWLAAPPTGDQGEALREQLDEVLRIARVTSPTVRLRRAPTE